METSGVAGPGRAAPRAPSRRTAVFVWSALVAGIIVFAAVLAALASRGVHLTPAYADRIGWVAVVLAVIELVLSRRLWIRPAAGAVPDVVAFARTVIALAMNEGAALFSTIVWTLGGSGLALVALLISLVGLALAFPSAARWRRLGSLPAGGASRPLVR